MRNSDITFSRRSFIGGAAALAASSMIPGRAFAAADEKPNSKFNGVQIGTITYSFRSMPGSAEDLLKYSIACGLSSIELKSPPAEKFAAEYAKKNESSDPLAGFKALRKMYNDAGVNIHIVKFSNIGGGMSDEEIDRCFEIAKVLGAMGITRELSEKEAKRLGPFADKHEIYLGFHNHTQLKPTTYDGDILSYGKFLGINLDIGHYVAGTGLSPLPLIEKHKDRIVSLHLKDRKKAGPNMPFGEGDTPIPEVLQYMRDEKLTFPADIELEYKIPQGSDAVKEVTKCVEFCKKALA